MMGRMGTHAQETPGKEANWAARIILGAVALLVLVVAYFALAPVLPIWWANVIRNQVQGNLGAGILVGMLYGVVFTFVPLLVAWQRILGTEATWFPLWTQISAIAAVVIFALGLILWRIWRQRGKKMKALQKADAERSLAAKAANDSAASSPISEAAAATDSQADRR